MARMSIDDRFLRDPRVQRMATAIGWSKYEARGRLLEVYAIVYDLVQAGRRPTLSALDIDTAADFPGLADRMVEFDLALRENDGSLRVRGSNEHTKYLKTRKTTGRAGGIKSGETRRNKAKQKTKVTFDENEGRTNPSDPVSVNPSAHAHASAPAGPEARAPEDPKPEPVVPARESQPERAEAKPVEYDPENAEQRGSLARHTWSDLHRLRAVIARELGLPEPVPPPPITPGTYPDGFRELSHRVREEGANAPRVCQHVLEARAFEARQTRDLEWLSEKTFLVGGWRTARERLPTWRKAAQQAAPRREIAYVNGREVVIG